MDKFKIVTPCHFGVESVLKREITDLGYDIVQVEDGRVTFEGDALAVCRANVFLRTAERVMIQVGRVKATIGLAGVYTCWWKVLGKKSRDS